MVYRHVLHVKLFYIKTYFIEWVKTLWTKISLDLHIRQYVLDMNMTLSKKNHILTAYLLEVVNPFYILSYYIKYKIEHIKKY